MKQFSSPNTFTTRKGTLLTLAVALLAGLHLPPAFGQGVAVAPTAPIRGPASIRLLEESAILKEDFEGTEMNPKLWRLRHDTPDRSTIRQHGGRLNLSARGDVQMEGYWGVLTAKQKDVVLVADMDIRSNGGSPHQLALHLCGGDGNRSPDHWVEILMVDLGGEARFAPGTTSSPSSLNRRQDEFITLPHPPGQGFTCRIVLNGDTNLAELSVKTAAGWRPICGPIDLTLRTVHAELKVHRQWRTEDPGEALSQAWFENVRIYPRPENHHLGIYLARADGTPVFFRPVGPRGRGFARFVDGDGHARLLSDLEVQLWTADGKQLVSAQRSGAFGFYLLPLKDAPWDVYPVAAQVRLVLDGKPFGEPVDITSQGLDGLYPDQVYELALQ